MDYHDTRSDDDGPTETELAALVAEEPLIAAGIALVDAEIRVVSAEDPTPLDVLRLRRAQARVAREAVAYRTVSRRVLPAAAPKVA
jgi:hypothetical protein